MMSGRKGALFLAKEWWAKEWADLVFGIGDAVEVLKRAGVMEILRGRMVGKRVWMRHSCWHRYAMRGVEEMETL